ncbi:hypothetical protein HK104_006072 [Borealophlyctis nickersoniae]|nr:hypothetical protein HK104_006072 [Borealophlyctis nickersoniae]
MEQPTPESMDELFTCPIVSGSLGRRASVATIRHCRAGDKPPRLQTGEEPEGAASGALTGRLMIKRSLLCGWGRLQVKPVVPRSSLYLAAAQLVERYHVLMANFLYRQLQQEGSFFEPLEVVKTFNLKTEETAKAAILAALGVIYNHFKVSTKPKGKKIKSLASLKMQYKYSMDIEWREYWIENTKKCLGRKLVGHGAEEFMEESTGVENDKPSAASDSDVEQVVDKNEKLSATDDSSQVKRKRDNKEDLPNPTPKKNCVQADDTVIKVLEPGIDVSPDFGDFGKANFLYRQLQQEGSFFEPLEVVKTFNLKTEETAKAAILAALGVIYNHFKVSTKPKGKKIKSLASLKMQYKYSMDIEWREYWIENTKKCLGRKLVGHGAEEFMEESTGVENDKPSAASDSDVEQVVDKNEKLSATDDSSQVKRKRDNKEDLPNPTPKKNCVQADDTVIKVLEPGIDVSPDFGDFGKVVTRIKELRSDPDRGNKLLYWGALDFRASQHKFPLPENETGLELLSNETIEKVKKHLSGLVAAAANSISDSCASLLMVLRTIIESHTGDLTFAKIKSLVMRGGILLLVEVLMEYIASLEVLVDQTDEAATDTMQSIALLRDALLKVDSDDKETQWLLHVIHQMAYHSMKAINPTERTTDVYEIVPFAINDRVSLRYGDGASKADAMDKRRRSSSAGGGKHVDFLDLIGTLELGSGENSRKGWQDSDLVAGTNSLLPSPCPREMSFRLTFNIGAELYALYQWARVRRPDDLKSTFDLAENFLISEHIMLHTDAAVKRARAKLASLDQPPVPSTRTAAIRLNFFKKSKWNPPSDSPMPGGTPKERKTSAIKKGSAIPFPLEEGGVAAKAEGDEVPKAAKDEIHDFFNPQKINPDV